jgi:hypothetical protein
MSMETKEKLARAALSYCAAHGWADVSLHAIAQHVGVKPQAFYPFTVADAADAIDSVFDLDATGDDAPNPTEPPRERLFEAAMRRFEAMEPHRAAIIAIENGGQRDPVGQATALARTARTARWLIAAAGLEGDGVIGAARAQGFALVLARARAAWRQDTAGDFAKTMAALDKGLRDAEAFEDRIGLRRRES